MCEFIQREVDAIVETAKRKHKLFDHPYLGGLVAMIIAQLLIANLGFIPALGVEVIRGIFPEISISAELDMNVKYISLVLSALVCLLILRLWFRKDGFKGCFPSAGLRNKEAWIFVLCGLVMDVVFTGISYAITKTVPVVPSVNGLLISLQAGVSEETIFRAVPASIMMKNNPSRKRMWMTVVITAAVFGLVHMSNVVSGAALSGAIVQSVNAACMGLLFAAIYLRSGNILLTMVLHTLHDVIAVTDPSQATGVFTTSSFSTLDYVTLAGIAAIYASAGLFLLRKSKWDEIKATWANIWNE